MENYFTLSNSFWPVSEPLVEDARLLPGTKLPGSLSCPSWGWAFHPAKAESRPGMTAPHYQADVPVWDGARGRYWRTKWVVWRSSSNAMASTTDLLLSWVPYRQCAWCEGTSRKVTAVALQSLCGASKGQSVAERNLPSGQNVSQWNCSILPKRRDAKWPSLYQFMRWGQGFGWMVRGLESTQFENSWKKSLGEGMQKDLFGSRI